MLVVKDCVGGGGGGGLLLCRLKRSELPSSTGVTSFILRLSFPSPFSTASSPLAPDAMLLAAIDPLPPEPDFSEKEVISAKKIQ